MSEKFSGFQAISGNEGEVVTFQEAQMSNPDPAAVRASNAIFEISNSRHSMIQVITRECGLPQGRALAEAVLAYAFDGCGWDDTEDIPDELPNLARAYRDALDGKAG